MHKAGHQLNANLDNLSERLDILRAESKPGRNDCSSERSIHKSVILDAKLDDEGDTVTLNFLFQIYV